MPLFALKLNLDLNRSLFFTVTLFRIFRGERKMLCGSLNPGLDLKVSRGHGLGTPPWYRSEPDGTNIYYVFKTGLNRTYDKSLME